MKQINKVIKNGVTYYLSDSALTQSVDTIVQELNNLEIPTDVSDLNNDVGYLTSSDFKTINNQSIVGSGNITIQGGDGVSVSSITQDEYDDLTPEEKASDTIWIITDVNPSGGGSYSAGTNIDITNNVISVTGMPTNLSDLTDDVGYATELELADVYDAIPTNVSDLNNDSGYLTSSDFKTINYQSIVGSGNINIQGGGGITIVELSQSDYDALPESAKTDSSYLYVISGATSNYYTKSEVNALIPTNTSDLTNDSNFVASTNLKTVGGQSVVGSGNISFKTINNSSIVGSGNVVVPTFTYDSTTQTLNITT